MPYSLKQTVPSLIVPSMRSRSKGFLESRIAVYDFRERDLELLHKFQIRTIFTITTDKNLHLYQKEIFMLAYSVRILKKYVTQTQLTLAN